MNARAYRLALAALALTLFALASPALSRAQGSQNIISTVAGGGPNNLPANKSSLGFPQNVAFDSAGNYYILDPDTSRVFKVDSKNNLTVVAGNGVGTYSGDGGPATSASLNSPEGMYLDGQGNIYIADTDNCVIRKVDATGTITTIAGIDPTASGVSTCGSSGDGGPAASAELDWPEGIYVDAAGDIYIADTNDCKIREIDATGTISTVAGDGSCGYSGDNGQATSAELNYPSGVSVDSAGNIFIADRSNCVVREVNASSGVITTVAGDGSCGYSGDNGLAASAQLSYPQSLFIDSAGNIYIADSANNAIRMVSVSTGDISTVAGLPGQSTGYAGDGGLATSAQLSGPSGAYVDGAGNIYIADSGNSAIREVSAASGDISTIAGVSIPIPGTSQLYGLPFLSGDGYQATQAELSFPTGIATDPLGDVFVADYFSSVVREISANGVISTVAGDGMYGSASGGNTLGDGGPATQAQFADPVDVALDSLGNVYVADPQNCDVREISAADGTISTVAGIPGTCGSTGDNGPAAQAELSQPFGLAFDSAGNLYIADAGNQVIREVTAKDGIIHTIAGVIGQSGTTGDNGPATQAELDFPAGVAVDGSGNIFIADEINCAIREVSAANGTISTVAGTLGQCGDTGDGGPATSAEIFYPYRVFVDYAGNLFIPDGGDVVREVSAATQDINVVAGQYNTYGFSGDGGPATSAVLAFPLAAAMDPYGNLLVADAAAARVRAISGLAVTPPEASLSQSSLNFQTEALGTPSALPVSVSDPGDTALSVSTVAISGANQADFSETDNCAGKSVAGGASCTINVTFTPSVAGTETASMTVTDAAGTQTVSLSGAGIDFSGAAAANGSTSATVTQGQTANYSLQLSATGGASPSSQISVTVSCSGAPQASTCTVPSQPVVVSPGTPGDFTVSVATTAPTAGAVPPSAIREFPGPRPMLLAAAGLTLALCVLAFLATVPERRRRLWLAFAAPVLLGIMAAGCGGNKATPTLTGGTPTGTYTLTVTTTSGSDSHTMQLTLTVNSAQ